MGKGTDAARALEGENLHADLIDDFKDQLLIAFIKRLGGKVDIPVKEVDETGRYIVSFFIDDGTFHFLLSEKS